MDTRINARVKPTHLFPRDTCPDHRPGEVRLKRALVKVRCGAPQAAPVGRHRGRRRRVFGALRGLRSRDRPRVRRLPPTLRTFRGLSVGTTAGGSDVVRDGAPVGAWAAGATAQHSRRRRRLGRAGRALGLPVRVGRPRATVEPAGARRRRARRHARRPRQPLASLPTPTPRSSSARAAAPAPPPAVPSSTCALRSSEAATRRCASRSPRCAG